MNGIQEVRGSIPLASMVESFGLAVKPAELLDIVRAEFLIDRGQLADLPMAVRGAMDHRQWALSLRGFERIRDEMIGGLFAIFDESRIGRNRLDPKQREQPLKTFVEVLVDMIENSSELRRSGHILFLKRCSVR